MDKDKQIIIDGVDVSGCKYYLFREQQPNGERCCGMGLVDCNGNDCLYKKYKRKEQECEAYKMEAEEGIEINAELKAKNDELKGKVKLYEEIIQRNARGFETGAQASMFADLVDGIASSIKDEKIFKLKTCLTEIKEIAQVNSINTCWSAINLCADYDEIEECGLQSPFEKLKAIIQKISECGVMDE